jgi:dUTP pyrophosphatase
MYVARDMRVKLLTAKAQLPVYSSECAAGADIYTDIEQPIVLQSMQSRLVGTGLAIELPSGYYAQLRPRSGLTSKGILCLTGTVDNDYRGELKVNLINLTPGPFTLRPGDRLAQLVIMPYARALFAVADDLSTTTRGDGGFGSTGR